MRWCLLFAVFATPLVARAQHLPDTTEVDRSGDNALEVWAGYSHSSPKWGVLGNRPGMSFAIAAARVTHRIATTETYGLDYTMDFIPVAMASPPLGYDYFIWDYEGPARCAALSCRFPEGSAYGLGFSPFGLTAIYRRNRAFQPRLGGNAGALLFDRRVPTIYSARFNFTVSLEAGAQLLSRDGDGILLVYRFHHLSNAGTADDNSALASHVISLGARWRIGGA